MRIALLLLLVHAFTNIYSQVSSDSTKPKSPAEKKGHNALIVVNGVVQSKRGFHNLDTTIIKLNRIESIVVLKDNIAIEKYGDRGKDGVIEIITTKRDVRITDIELKEVRENNDSNLVFEKVEIEPHFKGGEKAYMKFLEKNLDANVPHKNGAPEGTYTIKLQFIVEQDGTITNLRALTNHGFGMEEECIRIMKLSTWVAGIQNGRIVRAYKKQPITFVVTKD